ncbi:MULTISPECIES: maltose operon protein MalM [Glaesserella]|uniref:Maltose operon protein MalM n=1 Tax=Glaesserella australis TaxID=2094024 RepID=A0A328BYD8_9PAST|nr:MULTISPECIES: maltose operon protein MalM [Glaesserella]AUI66398.1 maltose operon protein MalM [Glaesserella sp. 15-184]RAL19388.1 maltose operon protein MalM [Glaesserella australis]
MKTKLTLILSSLFFAAQLSATTLQPTKAELAKIQWQDVALSQKNETNVATLANKLAGASGSVVAYKIPANQGTIKLNITSPVQKDNTVFVPNALILDAQFNPAMSYPSSQFKFSEERGLNPAQYEAELNLTPTANQDFIYLLVYTTEQNLQGKTTMTHPAKLLAKAKGNQPPAIADISVVHTNQGKVNVEVDGIQSSQFIGLNGPLFEAKTPTPTQVGTVATTPKATKSAQPVEQSTEDYFNQAVLKALKNNDVNKAMNLVNEAEQLGLKQPRQIFIKHVSAK